MWRIFILLLLVLTVATASEIPKERIVHLHGEIDDESARRVIAELLFHQMQNPNAPITLDIRLYWK